LRLEQRHNFLSGGTSGNLVSHYLQNIFVSNHPSTPTVFINWFDLHFDAYLCWIDAECAKFFAPSTGGVLRNALFPLCFIGESFVVDVGFRALGITMTEP
jgi:hypothetical protein